MYYAYIYYKYVSLSSVFAFLFITFFYSFSFLGMTTIHGICRVFHVATFCACQKLQIALATRHSLKRIRRLSHYTSQLLLLQLVFLCLSHSVRFFLARKSTANYTTQITPINLSCHAFFFIPLKIREIISSSSFALINI